MPVQASTDRDLRAAGIKQHLTGARLLLIAGVLFALGLVLALLDVDFPGALFMALATPFTIAGVGLEASAAVARRAASGKPFA